MSASRTTQSAAAASDAALPLETLTQSAQASFATAFALPRKLIEANCDTGAEILGFMGRRMKAVADFWSGLGHSNDADDAATIQKRFMDKLVADYANETRTLVEVFGRNLQSLSELGGKEEARRRA